MLGWSKTLPALFLVLISKRSLSALSCDWPTDSGKLIPYIPGAPTTLANINSAEECREKCLSQTRFICAAVNYKYGECQLLTENKETAAVGEPDGEWQYFTRPLCAGIWLPWRAEKGTYIAEGTAVPHESLANLEECMTRCLRDPSGDPACNAINMRVTNNNCNLKSQRVGDEMVKAASNSNWQYFNRPISYLESSLAASLAKIEYKGVIGDYLQIFTEIKIQVNGYLVGWQYYLNTTNPCTSYAAIWRHSKEYDYTLIARTLLEPEDYTEPGVRFQFIQNELIGVKQGDLLSIQTNEPKCGNNLVSVNQVEGQATISAPVYVGFKVGDTGYYKDGVNSVFYRKASPALRAFVSAYISVSETPTLHHNSSLTDGKIWLRLPPLPNTEDSSVVAGYKVTCSTETDMHQEVNCYEGLVRTTSDSVLLILPDVTIPYYATIQVVRNFEGQELLEGNLSVSSSFCVGRKRTTRVNVSESTLYSVDDKVNVTVRFSHEFQDQDPCAKAIQLSIPGYNSSYRTISSDLLRDFTLQLEQGTTYSLTIHLLLADGSEIVIWSEDYTTAYVITICSTVSSVMSSSTAKDKTAAIASGATVAALAVIVLSVVLIVFSRRGTLQRATKKQKPLKESSVVEYHNHASETESPAVVVSSVASEEPANTANPATTHSELVPPARKLTLTQPKVQKYVATVAEPTYENSTRIPVDHLHHVIQEEKLKSPDHPFKAEFYTLSNPNLPCDEGRTKANAPKNRFKNITAFNTTRVKLRVTDQHHTDYINACYIEDYEGNVNFIAAQGPNDTTLVDMWRMVHVTKAKVIVMVTNIMEGKKTKCSPYWPSSGTAYFGKYKVTLTEITKYSSYTIRKMKYETGTEARSVTQCHYTEWYDQDIPSTAELLSFRARVKQEMGTSVAPAIVHCSAGVGRTGTYIALENLIQEAHDKKMKQKSVDVARCVSKLREQRMSMVQTPEQYLFLYEIVSEALSCGDTSVPCESFSATLSHWRKFGSGGVSELSEQFRKLNLTSKNITDEMHGTAVMEENILKNRDRRALPLDKRLVHIQRPEGSQSTYINATFANGYQQKNGFIVTQIPLSSTINEYWRMIVEQKCVFVISFNDLSEVPQHMPPEGKSIQAGSVLVTNLGASSWDGSRLGEDTATETQIECKEESLVWNVTVIEVNKEKGKLPTSARLVSLCQRTERYATSGSDVITIQCRNGCGLSGLFLAAMNLYMRTRIEHEVDIVLEVKLARLSRAQFISTQAEFEALYDFVDYYLSEFNTYSNFTEISQSHG